MTFVLSTATSGTALLRWYLEDSHARTFRSRGKEKVSTEPVPVSGGKCFELPMRYDRATSSWKTHRCLFTEVLPESSLTFPRSGFIDANGVCWERTTAALPIAANGFGFSLPTVTVNGNRNYKGASRKAGDGLETALRKMIPTPTAAAAKGCTLNSVKRPDGRMRNRLDAWALMLPTASAANGASWNTVFEKSGKRRYTLNHFIFALTGGGRLSPDFTDWMMGIPIGATESRPLGTVRFLLWRQTHFKR
jgi:hypothetical protein